MIKKVKFLFLVGLIDIAVFFGWALILHPFSPFRLLLIPLFLLLPKDIISSDNFQGNILPLLIIPLLLVINFIVFRKFYIDTYQNILKSFFVNLFLLIVPILLAMTVIFGPTIFSEKLLEESVVRNTTIIGEPSFILQVGATPGYLNFIMNLPVRINTSFNGVWIGNYFDAKYSPSNEQALATLTECNLDSHYLQGIQPPTSGGKNPPGIYTFSFRYNFHGSGCTRDAFNILIGKRLELLQTTNNKITVIKTFTVDSLKTEVYK